MAQALYRKYRPKNFDEVTGQKVIISTLSNAIINDKLSHAYLFSGPRGTGKTSIAKIIAKIVNCQNKNGILPCNECVCCTQENTDIVEIDAASNNGVDEIRELKSKINLVPTYGKYKIYIIDEVHMLTISAFNALLKTLEEPPKHIIFILATTEPQKIPMTILSRCQRFDFKKIDDESIVKRLKEITVNEKIEIEDNALYEIARISDGGMRDAINLLDQAWAYSDDKIAINDIHEINGTISQYEVEEFIKQYFDKNLEFILRKIDLYNNNGKNLIKLVQEIMYYLKNVIIYKKAPNYLKQNRISVEPYQELSKIEDDTIIDLIYALNSVLIDMKVSSNPKLNMELIFIKNIGNISNKNNIKIQEKDESKIFPNPQIEIFPKAENIIEEKIDDKKENILNKEIRINNTLARIDKKIMQQLKVSIVNVKPLLLKNKYSQFVSIILDGIIKAASDEYIIFMYKLESDALLFNKNVNIIEEIIEQALNRKYKTVALSEKEWEKIRQEFNTKSKNYKYVAERSSEKNKNVISNLFESIIEYK